MNAPLVYLPEHQKAAANKLLQKINDAVVPFTGSFMGKETERNLGIKIAEAIRDWLKEHPFYARFNIDFALQVDETAGKITIMPSFDMQRLMAGAIDEQVVKEGLINLKGTQ